MTTGQKKIILHSEFARTELGRKIVRSWGEENVRFGPSLQGDMIIPGPPISYAFCFLEGLSSQQILESKAARIDRLNKMFRHSILMLIAPSARVVEMLQRKFSKSDKLLIFPDIESAATALFDISRLMSDPDRRLNQTRYVEQLRTETSSSAKVAPFISSQFGIAETDANLLLDRFGSLSGVVNFGRKFSFRNIVRECPITMGTVDRLDHRFNSSPQLSEGGVNPFPGAGEEGALSSGYDAPGGIYSSFSPVASAYRTDSFRDGLEGDFDGRPTFDGRSFDTRNDSMITF